jgi:hypothetical protein
MMVRITTLSIGTFSITTFSLMTPSIKDLIASLVVYDSLDTDAQHNNTYHYGLDCVTLYILDH